MVCVGGGRGVSSKSYLLLSFIKASSSIYKNSIQFLVLNTRSYVNGCVKIFLLSFYQTSSFAKPKPYWICSS